MHFYMHINVSIIFCYFFYQVYLYVGIKLFLSSFKMSDDIEEGEIIEDDEICDITNISHNDDDVIFDFERVKHIPPTSKYCIVIITYL